jgi:hypothetical protein
MIEDMNTENGSDYEVKNIDGMKTIYSKKYNDVVFYITKCRCGSIELLTENGCLNCGKELYN